MCSENEVKLFIYIYVFIYISVFYPCDSNENRVSFCFWSGFESIISSIVACNDGRTITDALHWGNVSGCMCMYVCEWGSKGRRREGETRLCMRSGR